jgi:hypothetical protein
MGKLLFTGVAPRVDQDLMRHSDIKLTVGAYTMQTCFRQPARFTAFPI